MRWLMNITLIRSMSWRLGRKLYCMARREGENSPEVNGEYWLLEQVIATQTGQHAILVDIGANIGDWSARAAAELERRIVSGHVHAFEPAASTFSHLSKRFSANTLVTGHHLAFSDREGVAEFFVVGEHAGTNSLIRTAGATTESVSVDTFDHFMESEKLDHVLFVKSDTEGHDFSVLKGAAETFQRGKVDVWQFEYNHRWISGGSSLKQVFDFISDKPYRLGKLYGNGIEIYSGWNQELDRFFETNYVLVRRETSLDALCTRYLFDESNALAPA